MKIIHNKTIPVKFNDPDSNTTKEGRYSDLIRMVVNSPKQGGYNWDDQENRLTILKAVKDDPEEISLEDSYFTYFKKLIPNMAWPFLNDCLSTFRDDIAGIK